MATGAMPAGFMDPKAPLPAGDPLLLAIQRSSAPLSPQPRATLERVMRAAAPKPLRPRKERPPVAATVDLDQVRTGAPPQVHSVRPPAAPPRASAPAAPPAAAGVPTLLGTFRGGQDNNTGIPPDTAGAIGPQHVVNPLNNTISIFDRAGTLLSALPLDNFWASLGINAGTFDPKIIYDPYGARFVLVSMGDASKPTSSLLIAVSTTSDPTGTWIGDQIQVDDAAQGPVWLDYPSLGFTADKITVQVNMFTRDNNRFTGSAIYTFDKTSLYSPPHHAALQRFILRNQGITQAPALTYDAALTDQYLLSRWSGNVNGSGYLAVYQISGSAAVGGATLTRLGFITSGGTVWDSFPPGDFAPQARIPARVDVGDDRLLSVCYRNGVVYVSHAVMLPVGEMTRSAAQWWEIDVSNWTVKALGRVDDPTAATCFAFPTLAVNARADILIGCAHFTGASHASAAYVFKPSAGPAQAPVVFASGLDTYVKTFGGPANRWGDYSATQVDPVNDLDFWTVQEYAETPANTWGTMWAHIG